MKSNKRLNKSNEALAKEITNLKSSLFFFHKLIQTLITSIKRRSKIDNSLRKFFILNKPLSDIKTKNNSLNQNKIKKSNNITKANNFKNQDKIVDHYNILLNELKETNPDIYNKFINKNENKNSK